MKNEFMEIAIKEAQKAKSAGEVPVGAVVVLDGKVIGKAHNLTESLSDPCAHAEILAIKEACARLSNWRLCDASIYVTLEPCPMCAGAIINSRIKNVYFGAYDSRMGACGGKIDLFRENPSGHSINVYGGFYEDECKKLLADFFKNNR